MTGFVTRAKVLVSTALICLWGVQAMAADGLITLRSAYGPTETMSRLETAVKAKGLSVFARIDHAAGAAEVGLPLRPTEVLIFGNARGGTPLMQAMQTTGIDLPLKALVWQDAAGKTWLSYNDPSWIGKRHGLGHEADATVGGLTRLSQLKQKSLEYQGGIPKSLHYRAGAAALTIWPPAVIRGRGWTGRSRLSCFTRSF